MIEYKIDTSRQLIFVTLSGRLLAVDIMTYIDTIIKDPDFAPHFHSIVTIDDNVIFPSIEPDTISTIQPVVEGWAQVRKGSKWALVIPKATIRAMVESGLDFVQPLTANIRIFRNDQDALEWVQE